MRGLRVPAFRVLSLRVLSPAYCPKVQCYDSECGAFFFNCAARPDL